ncbi:glycine cleavage system protein GcvH [Candidatus Bathyarchaeota archaeon]|jgi:glycine cleavage system H protein|nr:MAG: glycine cleavage system protein GcvH [Candidatus Bathyarchaeota archaeon]
MMTDEYKIAEGLYYTKEHEWAKKLDDGMVAVGIDDYAQAQLHEVVYVELPVVGSEISQAEAVGAVESVKAVSDFYCPVSGKVVEVNVSLLDSPEQINNDPYGEGWIAKIEPSNLEADLGKLMDAAAYAEYLKTVSH